MKLTFTIIAIAGLAACAPGVACDPRDPLGICYHAKDNDRATAADPAPVAPSVPPAGDLPPAPTPDAPAAPPADPEPETPPATDTPRSDGEITTPTRPNGPPPREGCNGRGCAPGSGGGNSEGNEQSQQDGD